VQTALILLCKTCRIGWRAAQFHACIRLTGKLFLYLTGFLECGIRPETGKKSQKPARGEHVLSPLTTPALNITRLILRYRADGEFRGALS
jgi:hypothetical protein